MLLFCCWVKTMDKWNWMFDLDLIPVYGLERTLAGLKTLLMRIKQNHGLGLHMFNSIAFTQNYHLSWILFPFF